MLRYNTEEKGKDLYMIYSNLVIDRCFHWEEEVVVNAAVYAWHLCIWFDRVMALRGQGCNISCVKY